MTLLSQGPKAGFRRLCRGEEAEPVPAVIHGAVVHAGLVDSALPCAASFVIGVGWWSIRIAAQDNEPLRLAMLIPPAVPAKQWFERVLEEPALRPASDRVAEQTRPSPVDASRLRPPAYALACEPLVRLDQCGCAPQISSSPSQRLPRDQSSRSDRDTRHRWVGKRARQPGASCVKHSNRDGGATLAASSTQRERLVYDGQRGDHSDIQAAHQFREQRYGVSLGPT